MNKVAATPFGNVKTVAKSKATKTKIEQICKVTDQEVVSAITKHLKGKKLKAEGEAMIDMADGVIKPFATKEWIKEYLKTGRKPESFILAGIDDESLLFIIQQSYNRSGFKDEAREKQMTKTYGDDIIKKTNTFVFDNDILDKYQDKAGNNKIAEIVLNAINSSTEIEDKDKGELIKVITKTEINKEALVNMKKYIDVAKVTPEQFLADIQPTKQLRGRGEK